MTVEGSSGTQHGFTLVELMICVVIAGLVAMAIGAFFLQHRALTRGVSVDRELEQTGRLVLDRLRRDARVAGTVSAGPGRLLLAGRERRVSYKLKSGALVRTATAAGEPPTRDVYPRVQTFHPRPSGRTLNLQLTLAADLAVVHRRRELRATLLLEARP